MNEGLTDKERIIVIKRWIPKETRREFLNQLRDYTEQVRLGNIGLISDIALRMEIKKYINQYIQLGDLNDEEWEYLFTQTKERDILNDLCERYIQEVKTDTLDDKFMKGFRDYWNRTEEERFKRKEKAIWLLMSE